RHGGVQGPRGPAGNLALPGTRVAVRGGAGRGAFDLPRRYGGGRDVAARAPLPPRGLPASPGPVVGRRLHHRFAGHDLPAVGVLRESPGLRVGLARSKDVSDAGTQYSGGDTPAVNESEG